MILWLFPLAFFHKQDLYQLMFFFNNLWSGTVPVTSVIQPRMEAIKCDRLHFQNKCAALPEAPTVQRFVVNHWMNRLIHICFLSRKKPQPWRYCWWCVHQGWRMMVPKLSFSSSPFRLTHFLFHLTNPPSKQSWALFLNTACSLYSLYFLLFCPSR